jgi:hypothetical protein
VKTRELEFRDAGILECWNTGMLEYWKRSKRSAELKTAPLEERLADARLEAKPTPHHESTKGGKHEGKTLLAVFRAFQISCFRDWFFRGF